MDYTNDQKISSLSREVRMRKRVYSRQVLEGRMDKAKADEEIGIMSEILAEYQARRDAEQPSLFDA